MSGPIVVRDPVFKIKYTGGTPTTIDLSCNVLAVDIRETADIIDIGTFCSPGATEVGKVTSTIVVATLWSPELHALLSPHKGEVGTMQFQPQLSDPKVIAASVKIASLPWGRFEIGQRVEDDLPLAVLGAISYTTALPLAGDEPAEGEPAAVEYAAAA